jgi:hypothetical protein
MVRGMP